MSAADFHFLSGAGNDFVALAEPAADPSPQAIRAWCRRGLSIGADGVFRLDRTARGIRMRYWNADGSVGELCLNGSRCAALLAFELGWGTGGSLTLLTDAGTLDAQRLGTTEVAVSLPPIIGEAAPMRLTVDGQGYDGWRIDVGVPHWVVPWAGLANAPVADLGPALRRHPDLGPAGANIDFVHVRDKGRLHLRTFERGVEAETLACGTGVVAAVAVAAVMGDLALPASVATAGGFDLTVEGTLDDRRLVRARLAGEARRIASGRLAEAAALEAPAPPWTDIMLA